MSQIGEVEARFAVDCLELWQFLAGSRHTLESLFEIQKQITDLSEP
jgi:hypothetical protein